MCSRDTARTPRPVAGCSVHLVFRVQGSGFGVWGLEFRVWGLDFGDWSLEFRVWGLEFGVWDLPPKHFEQHFDREYYGEDHLRSHRDCRLGFRVQGSGFRVQGAGFRVQGSGFRVQDSGFRVRVSLFRVQG